MFVLSCLHMRAIRARAFFVSAAAAALFALSAAPAAASTSDVWRLGIWSGTAGWIVMNCISDGSCNAGNGNYGVTIDPVTDAVSGWAWSGNLGWVCFGATCSGTTPEGGAAYASVDPITNDAHGWGKIESLGDGGWILMNCADMPGCGTAWKVNADRTTGTVTGWGWNGNADGSGIGWIDFSPSILLQSEICTDGIDNDGDGQIDCADSDCLGQPGPANCGIPYVCGPENDLTTCNDGCDNDGDIVADCADPTSCLANPAVGCPATEDVCNLGTGDLCCSDGTDNDHDGPIDCFDTDCAGLGGCPSDEVHWPTCQPPDADGGGVPGVGGCCANVVDDDVNGPYDCADPSCSEVCSGVCAADNVTKCIPGLDWQCPADPFGVQKCDLVATPWLQSYLNDIYSKGMITAANPPPSGKFNATFCLLTPLGQAGVVKFVTDPAYSCGATQSGASGVGTPSAATNYATALGRLDIAGIEKGAYGPVTKLTGSQTDVVTSGVLGKRVWFVDGDLTLGQGGAATFANGSAGDGAGLVVVRGGNLTIMGNLSYGAGVVTNLKNLASIGFLVLKSGGVGGDVIVDPGVTTLAGAYFAEGSFTSGASMNPLTVYGPVVAKSFSFGRTFKDLTRGSEYVIYDSRTVLNPPPGLADVAKSLPAFSLGTP